MTYTGFRFTGRNAVPARPADDAQIVPGNTWARNRSSAGADDGTEIDATWANRIRAALEAVVTGLDGNLADGDNQLKNAIKGYVDGKIDDLKASAPGLLDTLDELAAALGDDANFAATVTTALAGKVATSRTISAAGLATGGGDLSANRTITVTAASQAEAEAGVSSTVAMTPQRTAQAIAALAPIALSANQSYKHRLPGASGLLSGEEGVAIDCISRDAIINDYADTLSDLGSPEDVYTVYRSTVKYVVGRSRLLESVAANTFAYHHDPLTGEPKGALLEPAATNLLTYSEELGNPAGWGSYAGSVSSNATTSPLGTTLADKLVEDTSDGGHAPSIAVRDISVGTYTASIFAKKGERNYICIESRSSDYSSYYRARFNLDAGTWLMAVGAPPNATARISPAPNGFYRCELTFLTAGTTTGWVVAFWVSNGEPDDSYLGDGTSGVYAFGAQLEPGPVATSYIPTTSSSATRAQDYLELLAADAPISGGYGTFFLETQSSAMLREVAEGTLLTLSVSDYSDSYYVRSVTDPTSPSFNAIGNINGALVADADQHFVSNGAIVKTVMAFQPGRFAQSANGSAVAIRTFSGAADPFVRSAILSNTPTFLRRAGIITRPLADTEVQAAAA